MFLKGLEYTFSDGIYRTKNIMKTVIEFQNKTIEIEVPFNFGWNGVTSFRTTKKSLIPSMIHDWLIYDERINGVDIFSRGDMDKIFLILCKTYGVPYWERFLMKQGLAINRNILMKLEKKQQ